MKRESNSNTIVVRGFNAPLLIMDTRYRQKINKDTLGFNNYIDQMIVLGIYIYKKITKQQNNTHSSQICTEFFQGRL